MSTKGQDNKGDPSGLDSPGPLVRIDGSLTSTWKISSHKTQGGFVVIGTLGV